MIQVLDPFVPFHIQKFSIQQDPTIHDVEVVQLRHLVKPKPDCGSINPPNLPESHVLHYKWLKTNHHRQCDTEEKW